MSRLHKNKQYLDPKWTIDKVSNEINFGLSLLNKIDNKIIAFFGSSRLNKNSIYYKHCEKTAFELGRRDYAIVSGAGPGIMHAANSGAMRAKVPSIGLRAELLTNEYTEDPIFTHDLSFHFIFVRRFIMSIKSEALVFYPGGYGTLNELFEYAVLMQVGIVDTVPLICVNKKYWSGLIKWLRNKTLKHQFIDLKDLNLLYIVDDTKEIIKIIEKK